MTIRNNVRRGQRHEQSTVPVYYMPRPPTTADQVDRWTNKRYELNSQWIIGKNPYNTIPVASGTEGDLYYLSKYDSNGDAIWLKFDNTGVTADIDSLQVDFITAPGVNPVEPDANGLVQIFGNTVANGTNAASPVATHSRALNQFHVDVQISKAISSAPANPNDVGLSSYEIAEFDVDGNGYVSLKHPFGPQLGSFNLALYYSAGTATLKGADGNDLSATNPAYVWIRSNVTQGKLIQYTMTSNFTFDDAAGASSVFAGSLFGMTTLDTTTGARFTPFYLYAMADNTDSNLSFFCNRYSGATSTRNYSSGTLKDAGSGGADTFREVLALEVLGGSITNYDNKNATQIGSFSMLINGSDDWVIQALESPTGIGRYYGNQNFVHSKGIMGQQANSYFLANGGTAPTDTTVNDNQFIYSIDQDQNILYIRLDTTMAGSPAGAVDAILNVPITGPNTGVQVSMVGTLIVGGNCYTTNLFQVGNTYGTTNRQFYLQKSNGTTARWQYAEFTAGDRLIITQAIKLS